MLSALKRIPAAPSHEFVQTQPDSSLLDRFKECLQILPAGTPEGLRRAQEIRYQVYCVEYQHEKADDGPGIERDEFDGHAVHSLLSFRGESLAFGTVRLILPLTSGLENSFAVQKVLNENTRAEFARLPLHRTGEVSRFCISRELRQSAERRALANPSAASANMGPLMRLGLIQGLLRMSVEHGITHWCAAMEPTLLRMLAAMAIRFTPAGPLVDYHGLRQPCYCRIASVLDDMRRERPAFYAVVTDGGALQPAPCGRP